MTFLHSPVSLGYTDLESFTDDSGRLYLTDTGRKYPSITTVLSILSKDSIAKWRARVGDEVADAISHKASERGTDVHNLIEKYIDNNSLEDLSTIYTPYVFESLFKIKNILDERITKVYAQECPLYSDHLRVAGRVDCVAEFDGKISIIDFKTSRKPKRKEWITSYFCQEAAYAIMWEERTGMPVEQLVTIVAVDGSRPQVFIEQRDDWVFKLRETIDVYYKTRD